MAVQILSANEADLSSHYWFQQTAGSTAMDHIAVRFPGQTIQNLEVAANGRILPSRFNLSGDAIRLTLEVPTSWEGEYEIRYRLKAEHNDRIPLMLPVLPPALARAPNCCDITLKLPVGYELLGGPFPHFVRRENEHTASLPDFPGFLVVPARPIQGVTRLERFLTVDTVTNGCLLLFLAGMMAWRLSLRRP